MNRKKVHFTPVELAREEGGHFTPVELAREEGAILPRRSEATRRLTVRHKKNLLMKMPAVRLFHNSSEESKAPGTEINSLLIQSLL